MRRIVLYTLTSLDGAVDDPNRYFPAPADTDEPHAPTFDDDLVQLEARLIAAQDAVLLGRRMYDEWSHYWPTSDEQPFAGSIELAQSLLAEGLVDEVHLAVAPVADPVGRRLFERLPDLRRLSLVSATPTVSGALWLVYRPAPASR